MPDASQRLHEQRKVLETLQDLSGKIRDAETGLSSKAASALEQSLAIRPQVEHLPSEYLPRERQALLTRLNMLDDRIDEALRQQVRGIFARQGKHTADALRKDYLEVGLKNPDLLKRLTDAMVTATEALNQEKTDAANSQAQVQQRWQAVYAACKGQQPELAAARKKAKSYLSPWWQKPWPLLAGGAILTALLALAIVYMAQPREEPAITGLEPSTVNAESVQMILIVSGRNFTEDAVIQWVGTNDETVVLTPTLRSTDRVTATVGADLLQRAGTVRITMHNRAANQVSNEKLLVIQALTATPTPTPVTPTDTPILPTHTPTPTPTPTLTPTPIIGDLPCVLKLTVDGNGEAKLPIDAVTFKESKKEPVSWSFTVIPYTDKDCGQTDVEEVTKRDYRLMPADEAEWIVQRTSNTLRLNSVGPVKVKLDQEWMVRALSEDQKAGSLTFGLEYQLSAEEWKEVQGSDGQPLQITLTWGPITVATATPKPTPTRAPTPTPSLLNGTITLIEPTEGQTLSADRSWTFKWGWNGPALEGSQTFLAKITKNGTTDEFDCTTNQQSCQQSLPAGEYAWKVWIDDGNGKIISNESSQRTFVVREPQPEPPPALTPTPIK